MDNKDLEAKTNQLRGLHQYKNKTEAELIDIAKKKLEEESIEGIEWVGLEKKEEKQANLLYNKYLKIHNFESFSDKEDLKHLIQNLIIYDELLRQLHKKAKSKTQSITERDIKSKNSLEEQVAQYKERLGLSQKKQSKWKEFWLSLKKRILFYAETHSGAFYFKCPSCQKMALLLRKVDDYKTFDFKMFRGTHLYNETLLRFIEEGKLTQEEVAEVWGLQHTDYIKGIYDLYLAEKHKPSA